MHLTRAFLVLSTLGSTAFGQVIGTGPFTGQVSENFDHLPSFVQPGGCTGLPVFAGLGQMCVPSPDSLMVVYSSTGPGSNPCSLVDHTTGADSMGRLISNIDLNGDQNSGVIELTFTQPVVRIGGWFANNDSINIPDQGTNDVRIFDAGNNILLDTQFDMPNDCTWTWNGWEVASGALISRIEFQGGSSSRDITVDDFEIDFASLGTGYCTANANSLGSPALISAAGSASIAANVLSLSAGPVPDQPGIFFWGPNQADVPFGHGVLCVGTPQTRGDVIFPTSNQADVTLDTIAEGFAPGAVNFSYWYRDPAAGAPFFNFSDAVSVTFEP